MRKTYLLFVLLLSLMGGVNVALAQTSVNEGFEDWTSTEVADGWLLINNATYGSSYTYDYVVSSTDFIANKGKNCLSNSSHSAEQGTVTSPMIVTPAMTGTFSFNFRKYNSSSSTKGYINIFEYDETTGAATGTSIWTCRPNGVNEATSKYQSASITVGSTPKRYAIYLAKVSIDDLSFTGVDAVADGAALKVKGDADGKLDFGLVSAGATKSLTLSNPGSESITVGIEATGGFGVDNSQLTIAAGKQATLTVSTPDATASGTLTITPKPAVEGIDPVEIALSCVVKDPAKGFVDFANGKMPVGWNNVMIGNYGNGWEINNGYASHSNSATSYYLAALTSPKITFTEGETLLFDVARYGSATYNTATVKLQTSVDGTAWTDVYETPQAELVYGEWKTQSVSMAAGTYYIRFYGGYAHITNIYGGVYDDSPIPLLEVEGIANGGSLDWGYADVPAGSTKIITLKNDGTADLSVTIAATDDYTVDPTAATVDANGGTVVVTIGTPAHNGNGKLTITPAAESGLSPYTISLTSYYKEPKPVMAIDKTAIAFGRVNEVKTETVTVSNSGDADLVATIANDNTENFTVSTESLTVAPGETGTFTVTYNYAEGTWGTFSASIKVTPNYGSTFDVKTITATATSKDPNVWEEDFEEGIPSTWTNNGWIIYRKWNEDNSVNHAYSGTSDANTLITPRLLATEGQVLEFNVINAEESYPLTVEYSNDLQSWTKYAKVTEEGTATFTAPAAGNYYLRFSGRYIYLDDFSGFKLDIPAAEAIITASTLPATGNQYVAYEASVTVQNKGTEAQTAVAKLIVDGEEKDSQETALAVDATATLTLSFTPEVALDAVDAKIEVTLKDVEDFVAKTVEGTLTVNAATVIDEAATEQSFSEGTLPSVVLKYKAKNGWNTIGVPFALTNDYLTKIFGEGWKAYELAGYSVNEISFKQAADFYAGYPYIVYAKNAPESDGGIVLTSVNIASGSEKEDVKSGLAFRSTYTRIDAGEKLDDWWGVTNEGRIQPAGTGASLKGLRGYFYMNAEAPDTNLNEARIVFINSDGTVTAINSIKSQFNTNGNTYDLSGRKMSGSLKQGVYIQNGKKIVVK